MRPLPDTPETAFEEVASALWPYARYSEKARPWCSFKAMLGRLLPIKRRSLKPASRPPESVTDPIVASADRPNAPGTLVRPRTGFPAALVPRNPLSDLVNRRRQARPGDRTGVGGVAHVHVNRRAEALNRRESDLDRGLEIAGLKLRWN